MHLIHRASYQSRSKPVFQRQSAVDVHRPQVQGDVRRKEGQRLLAPETNAYVSIYVCKRGCIRYVRGCKYRRKRVVYSELYMIVYKSSVNEHIQWVQRVYVPC